MKKVISNPVYLASHGFKTGKKSSNREFNGPKGVRSLHIEGFNAVVYQYFNYIIDTLKLIHMIIFEIPRVGGRVINRPLAESRYYVIKND
jgi:hypothetical protein